MVAGILCFTLRVAAQDNIWTSPTSGNWQDGSWSLGVLPGTNHNVWVTNYGWKAVQISVVTMQTFPQSLNVNALNISSPTDSFNTLLLNHAGTGTPLTVKTMTVASNSAVTLVSSALQINGPNGAGAVVGGQFDQNDSVVAGNQINVGYIGSGIYNFNSGYFTVSHLWLGGFDQPGLFNQNGGTNGFGITHLDGGTYVLSNGFYGASIYFDKGGAFFQEGGQLVSDLTLFNGSYVLAGGVHQGSSTVPSPNGFAAGFSGMSQFGGTNLGSLDIGSQGTGLYTMTNGVCLAPSVTVGSGGNYSQSDGLLKVSGPINIHEVQVAMNSFSAGQFHLQGGQVSASGILLEGFYEQTGGTNLIAGDLTMQNIESSISLSGGLLAVNNLVANAGWQGGVALTGGTLIISNDLRVGGIDLPNWRGFSGGGTLIVSNISLAPLATFSCGDGVICQTGMLTMSNAKLYSGSNSVQLGRLCLASGGNTNSTLFLSSPSSKISFADSSGVTWSKEMSLMVEGWNGSLLGGGSQQIVFGKNAGALTSAQVGQIQFHNPAGLAEGTYPARILSTGEMVPVSAAALPASMALSPQPGGMQVILKGEAGHVYSIETSTDLVHWASWANQMNSTGTIRITDTDSANYPMRFYRAKPMP